MSQRIVFPTVLAISLIAAGALTGCSAGALPGGVPGGSSNGAAAGSSAGSAGAASGSTKPKCTASGTTIPAGTYSGTIKSTLKTVMSLNLPNAAPISNAGSGAEEMNGTVHIVSNGRTVTGAIDLGGPGTSQINGAIVIHSTTGGAFTGTISGPANNPVVTARLDGAWVTLDGPLPGDGHATSPTTVGLHVTSVSCGSVTGDAIAMFAEVAKPVAQYITISGAGAWTAKRK